MKLSVLVAVIAIILNSCSLLPTRSVYINVPLPIPVEPVWENITAADVECLSSEAYEKLLKRDLQHEGFESKLMAILKSTHE